jgi:diguanylate cyclase (GGDEF)-like protein
MTLRLKLFLPLVVFCLLFVCYANWYWLPRLTDFTTQQNHAHLSKHLESIGESLMPLLLERELGNIYGTLDTLLESNPEWKQIKLHDADNRLLYPATDKPMPAPRNNLLVFRQPIKIHTRTIGRLDLAVDISPDITAIQLFKQSFLVALLFLLFALGTVFAILVELIVSRPINKLAIAADNVSKGEYFAQLPNASADEVGHLVKCFKSMRNALQSYKGQVEQEIEGHKTTTKELAQQKERFAFHASHDSLTGLINRREFEVRLRSAIDRAQKDGIEHTVCFIDLDRFKIINDSCGHIAGDELLKQTGGFLKKYLRTGDSVARLGGDEFALLLESCPLNLARKVVHNLHDKLQEFLFSWDDQIFKVNASIGVAAVTKHTTTQESVLTAADDACYTAKEKGRNRYHINEPGDNELSSTQRGEGSVSGIIKALEKDQFIIYGQPIVAVNGGTGQGQFYEVLLRMIDDEGQQVLPGKFIPVAERYNLMTKIDRWVIQHALEILDSRKRISPDQSIALSINLSGSSMSDANILPFICDQVNRLNVNASEICFEITETDAISDLVNAQTLINELKNLGCKFALDDFGSGFSSFAYLKNLTVDYLKIDGLFVRGIVQDPIDLAMVRSIHEIGKVIGIQTIAEFVENEEILVKLRQIGVNYAQGFGIARPAPLVKLLDSAAAGEDTESTAQGVLCATRAT